MRTSLCVIAALGSALGAALAAGAGCGMGSEDCALLLNCNPTSSSTAGGGGNTTPKECIPSAEAAAPVSDACGVFVASGDGVDAADRGSKEKPLKSLAVAVQRAKAQGKPVYACAEEFSEAILLDARVELYGGLDCKNNWSYDAMAKTTLTADADRIPLTLSKATSGTSISDFIIVAKDAVKEGSSSIAVIVDQATATFAHCHITAGKGAAGIAGTIPTDDVGPEDPNATSIVGNNGVKACTIAGKTPGGLAKDNVLCPFSSGGPLGGNGGDGLKDNGLDGLAKPADDRTALGGAGQAAADTTLDCSGAGRGSPGKQGTDGAAGDGALGDASLGSLDASGYKGVAGSNGGNGQPGQGGGGGGGAKGKTTPSCAGASGGGGGAGGCGGHGGKGGGAGGSSIGILSLTAQLTLTDVNITARDGGNGGDGGDGQQGGIGGRGGIGGIGSGTTNACTGGDGGPGGTGGKGGGGRGGHSLGIAYAGMTEPPTVGVKTTLGMAGAGGKGADMTKDGQPGVQSDRQKF